MQLNEEMTKGAMPEDIIFALDRNSYTIGLISK